LLLGLLRRWWRIIFALAMHQAIGIGLWRFVNRHSEIVHDFQRYARLFFQCGAWAAHRKHQQIDRPENRDAPQDDVARFMALAEDAALAVHTITGHVDYASVDGNHGVGLNNHAVETQLHPSFANEMAGIFEVFESSDKIAVIRHDGAAITF
jgi:hypothetical protein